jgi:hypothetical protein
MPWPHGWTSTVSSTRVDIDAIASGIDLNTLVDKVDVTRLVDRLDLDDVVARVDIARVVERVNIVELARYVVQEIDLPALIRSSTTSLSSDVVRGVRDCSRRLPAGGAGRRPAPVAPSRAPRQRRGPTDVMRVEARPGPRDARYLPRVPGEGAPGHQVRHD